MLKILFVCHGNICRSPMAEYVMKDLVKKAGLEQEIEVASAATSSEEIGNPVYPPARQKLAEHGIGCGGHAARRLVHEDYDHFDYIVGMDGENLDNMLRPFGGDPEGRLSLLLEHTSHPRDVSDPWYSRNFETTWRDVSTGCAALLAEVLRAGPSSML